MNILQKIQGLSDPKKKIIFWLILIIVGFLLLFLWGKSLSKKIQNLHGQDFLEGLKFPKLQEKIKNISQPSKDDFKKIEEIMKTLEE